VDDSRQCSVSDRRSISATWGSSASFACAAPATSASHSIPASQRRPLPWPIRWPMSTPRSVLVVVGVDEMVGGELAVGQAGQALDRLVVLLQHRPALF